MAGAEEVRREQRAARTGAGDGDRGAVVCCVYEVDRHIHEYALLARSAPVSPISGRQNRDARSGRPSRSASTGREGGGRARLRRAPAPNRHDCARARRVAPIVTAAWIRRPSTARVAERALRRESRRALAAAGRRRSARGARTSLPRARARARRALRQLGRAVRRSRAGRMDRPAQGDRALRQRARACSSPPTRRPRSSARSGATTATARGPCTCRARCRSCACG